VFKEWSNVQEVREIRFWFKSSVAEGRRDELTEDFFKDLLSPTDFPTGTFMMCFCHNHSLS